MLWMAALLASGCALLTGPKVVPTRFFLLTSARQGEAAASLGPERSGVSLGVGPVVVPSYLDRPQMVTRVEANQLRISETDRWAEPLRSSVPRVLSESLGRDLDTNRVVIFPWYRVALDYQVKIELLRFEPSSKGEVILEALWAISNPKTDRPLATRSTTLRRAVDPADADAVAASMSALLADLSREIAAAIRKDGTTRRTG
jgi:uncharacterized lipoprotein YmbA